MQNYTSANTSINSTKLPMIFTTLIKGNKLQPHTINLDVGGGKFDNATDYLKQHQIKNLIYDKYNRTKNHNKKILKRVSVKKADSCTCSNVLNIIDDEVARHEVIQMCYDYLKPNAIAYFKIYEGDSSGIGKVTKADCWQNNQKTTWYIHEIKKVFPKVERHGSIIYAYKYN